MTSPRSPVYAYLKNPSMVDFPGRLAAVFFTAGCNFRCAYCHNTSLMGPPRDGLPWPALKTTCEQFQRDWVHACVLTGGEPTLAANLPETIHFFKQRGWAIKLDTNGSRPSCLETILPQIDYVALDIKAAPASYPALTGFHDTDALRQSINLVREQARDYEFRTTILEAVHTIEEMETIGELIRGAKRLILQPFVPRDGLPDQHLAKQPRTHPRTMDRLAGHMRRYVHDVRIR